MPGVVGAADASRRRSAASAGRSSSSDLHIDIGAKRPRGRARGSCASGDAGVWDGEPLELPNGRFISKSMDNRLGAYVALEAARRVAESGDAQVDVVGVAAVQEELGYYGARTAAFSLDPDVAIAIDVTHATDVPGGDPKTAGRIDLGSGAAIARGPILNTVVTDLLAQAAEEEGIAHTFEVLDEPHADRRRRRAHLARAACRPASSRCRCGTCTRPSSSVSLDDLEAVIALVVALRDAARRPRPASSAERWPRIAAR